VSQIDAMFKFASLAAAKADPVVQHYMSLDDSQQAQFQLNIIIPGVQVWRASQDVIGTDADGNPTVTHTLLPGYFIFVSADHVISELRDHPALQVAVDRDKMNARQVGMVLKSTITNSLLQDLRFQPIYAGMNPPWGSWQ
jgi:hypothetical protein